MIRENKKYYCRKKADYLKSFFILCLLVFMLTACQSEVPSESTINSEDADGAEESNLARSALSLTETPAAEEISGESAVITSEPESGQADAVTSEIASFPEAAPDFICDYSEKYTYEQMQEDLNKLETYYGSILQIWSMAKTVDGRDVYAISLSPGKTGPGKQIMINGGIHAREYITSQLVMKELVQLVRDYAGDQEYQGVSCRDLLAQTGIIFIPMLNPDGIVISQFGPDALHYETVRENVKNISAEEGGTSIEYYRRWKSNADGVDLNRQFDADWNSYDDHVGHPSADHYKGTAPECEPESKAVADLIRENCFRLTITYHAQGQVIYWYYKQTGQLEETTKHFADIASTLTGYTLDSDYQNLDPAGLKDWAVYKMGTPSITIEVGTGSCPVDPAQFDTIWVQNKDICSSYLLDLYEPS